VNWVELVLCVESQFLQFTFVSEWSWWTVSQYIGMQSQSFSTHHEVFLIFTCVSKICGHNIFVKSLLTQLLTSVVVIVLLACQLVGSYCYCQVCFCQLLGILLGWARYPWPREIEVKGRNAHVLSQYPFSSNAYPVADGNTEYRICCSMANGVWITDK
jgi:hypothetical protein